MATIFALGGGELKDLETLSIDREVVAAAHKPNPKALFIPTASGEAEAYVDSFQEVYGEKLGCQTDTLFLLESNISSAAAREKIAWADLIYVGGGDTRKMIETWQEYGVDEHLRQAFWEGTVLSGLSAGSICWFKGGHSDADSFESEGDWDYTLVDGINLIDAIHCPHYNEGNRAEDFAKMMAERDELGIAIENNCALEFKDHLFRVLKSDPAARAYKFYQREGKQVREELTNSEYLDIITLLKEGYDG